MTGNTPDPNTGGITSTANVRQTFEASEVRQHHFLLLTEGIATQVPADARLTIDPVSLFEATLPGPTGTMPIQVTAPGSQLSQRGIEITHHAPLPLSTCLPHTLTHT